MRSRRKASPLPSTPREPGDFSLPPVSTYNAEIERALPGLIEQRAAKLDALRKFNDDLDLDEGAS